MEPYKLPDITLVSQDRVKVRFKDIAASGKPVALALNYTTCTTVYPLIAAGFANLQRKLGPDAQKIWLISISIDPEYDTPELMKEYLQRYGAKPGWDFLTGSKQDIVSLMRAFDSYVADKMDKHTPLTFIWLPGENRCIRIHGLLSTKDLMKETGVAP
jgi:protein SCO1/2